MSVSTVPEGGAYTILTDSACDIPAAALAEWGVPCCSQTFVWDGSPRQYTNDETPLKTFYARMRKGGVAKTSAINGAVLKAAFERELANGRDVLYLALSGGLSATYNAGRIAAEELREAYPAGKVLVVDSLSASAGFGLLLYLTVQRKKAGASLEEAAAFAEDLRMRLCHWFTVDDLTYLKRGGRVSSTAAFVAGVLHIKPVLHMDNEGHLVNMGKVNGRRAAVKALADKFGALAADPAGGTVFISHGDCPEDAETLKRMLAERYGASVARTVDIGPVIGAHSGPGTLALFFVGTER